MDGLILRDSDGDYKKLGDVSDRELTREEKLERFFGTEAFEFSVSEPDKLLRCVLGQSSYNAMKLKEDGYLSPENGWLEKGEEKA